MPWFSSSAYGWLMLSGIAVSLLFWRRLAQRDSRLFFIYAGALGFALCGAKLAFLAAEGWTYLGPPINWPVLVSGKTILGALLGGYAGVELMKRLTGYGQPTGDLFAVVVPLGIMMGRVGCMLHGCCLGRVCEAGWFALPDSEGIPRWPAAQLEFAFNLVAFIVILLLRRLSKFPNQLFHLYLVAYGAFRFTHEFWRNTPPLVGWLTGYQVAALLVLMLGLTGFVVRARHQAQPSTGELATKQP